MSGLAGRTWRSSTQCVRDWCAAGRDLFYPPVCAWCRKAAPASESRLCASCRCVLFPATLARCKRCSAPVGPHLETSSGCVHCQADRWKFGRAFALGPYADSLHEACQRMKRPGSEPLSAALALELAGLWMAEWTSRPYDLVVPVPHHWRQRVWRTQLAPVTLARAVSCAVGVPMDLSVVKKVKFTPQQASLTPSQRRANLRGAFAVAGGVRLRGGRILVVDDVLTTGTTADRVARALLDAGAAEVDAAVIARGIGRM